jgi:site-specific recombinase XerD
MPVISNPRTGDEFLNLLIVSGVDEETLQLMQRDIQKYVQSLSRNDIREYQRIFRTAKAEYCR